MLLYVAICSFVLLLSNEQEHNVLFSTICSFVDQYREACTKMDILRIVHGYSVVDDGQCSLVKAW